MTTFPALVPSSRTFTPGQYPASGFSAYGGAENRVRHSNVFQAAQLRLTFLGLTEAEMLSIWNHFQARQGEFQSFTLPAELIAGTTITDYVPASYRWRYGESGSVEDLPCGGHNVSLTLETVAPIGASVSGVVLSIGMVLTPGAGAGGAFVDGLVPGIASTVVMSLSPGAASTAIDGLRRTVGVSLSAGAAAGDVGATGRTLFVEVTLQPGPARELTALGINQTVTVSLEAGVADDGVADEWTPAEITTALWLDADDAGTITESGGFVTEWRDKSGNSRHATDPGSGLRPAYQATGFNGLPTLEFDGTNDRLGLSTAIATATTNSFDIFVAMAPNRTGRDNGNGAATIARMPGSEVAGSFYVGYTGDGRLVCHHHLVFGNNAAGSVKSPANGFTSASRLIAHYRYDSGAGAAIVDRWTMRLNGNSPLTKSTGNTSTGWGTSNAIGRVFSGDYSHRGLISEIIITPSTISSADRERVEGYLAHKWGLTADLPSGHPYKTSPPESVDTEPEIGDEYAGGYFAGYLSETADGIATHRLIVAPVATGASGSGYPTTTVRAWKNANTATTGTQNEFDGSINTANIGANHAAANFCQGLSIGGYDDWYLPARYELDIAYENLKPTTVSNSTTNGINPYSVPKRDSNRTASVPAQTAVAIFQEGGSQAFSRFAHWTSTENSGDTGEAWEINFGTGANIAGAKTNNRTVRAFRREPI